MSLFGWYKKCRAIFIEDSVLSSVRVNLEELMEL